jgi:hypothetical protein
LFRRRVLVGLLVLVALLLLVLVLVGSAGNGVCDCGSVEGILSFALTRLEEDDAFGDAGDGQLGEFVDAVALQLRENQ